MMYGSPLEVEVARTFEEITWLDQPVSSQQPWYDDGHDDDEVHQLIDNLNLENIDESDNYFTELGVINGINAVTQLYNHATFHAVTGIDVHQPNHEA